MGCRLTVKEARERKEEYRRHNKIMDDFMAENEVPLPQEHIDKMMEELHKDATGDSHRPPQTIEELKRYKIGIIRARDYLKKERSDLWYWFGKPDEILKDTPITKIFGNNVFKSVNHYKGITQEFDTHVNDFMYSIREGAFKLGAERPAGYTLKSYAGKGKISAEENLSKILLKFNNLLEEGELGDAKYLYQRKGGIYDILSNGEGKAFKQTHDLLISSKDPSSENYYKRVGKRKGYSQDILNAAETYHEKIHPKAKREMMDGLKHFRKNLVDKRHLFKTFKTKGGEPLYDTALTTLDNIIDRYNAGDLQKDGYFPVLSIDILPSLAESSNHIFHGKNPTEVQKGLNVIANLEPILKKNMLTNRNLQEKVEISTKGGERLQHVSSMNVIPIVDSYVRNAARFNMVAYNTGEYLKVTEGIYAMRGSKNLDPKLEKLQEYAGHMYGLISGKQAHENPGLTTFVRSVTAWQFASKLGLNLRSTARNATQSLLNFVWFGPKAIYQASDYGQSADMINRVNKGLEANGILFPNYRDVYMDEFIPSNRYDEKTGTYKEVMDPSWGKKIGDALDFYSQKSGFLMQKVENDLNRKWTYKIAYNLAWKSDKAVKDNLEPSFRRHKLTKWLREDKYTEEEIAEFKLNDWAKLREEKATEYGDIKSVQSKYDAYFEQYRRNRANNAGTWAVKELHYDYAPTGKSKILTTPLGATLGQFQHYSWSFFNFQVKIAQKAKDSIMADMWLNDSSWRMYRLGMLYSVMVPIFSVVTPGGWNWGNLVQNDTAERIFALRDAIMGDDEERKAAFYGKGPVIGLAGGPTVSDLITLGNVINIYDLEEDSWPAFLSGYQDYGDLTSSEKGMEMLRLGSTQGHRSFGAIQQAYNGTEAGPIIQREFGGHKTPWIEKARQKVGLEKKPEPPKRPKRKLRTPIDTLNYMES